MGESAAKARFLNKKGVLVEQNQSTSTKAE
jgi:hypothetical protein